MISYATLTQLHNFCRDLATALCDNFGTRTTHELEATLGIEPKYRALQALA